MAFSGYHLKFGGTVFPDAYIAAESYKSTPSQRMDLDSYRDSNGILHRAVLSHTATKIEWETPYLYQPKLDAMLSILLDNMSSTAERKITAEYYNQEGKNYQTGDFYMPDIVYQVYAVLDGVPLYSPIRIALIEY